MSLYKVLNSSHYINEKGAVATAPFMTKSIYLSYTYSYGQCSKYGDRFELSPYFTVITTFAFFPL